MQPFEFFGVGRIVIGRGAFARTGELAAGLGKSAIVIYNGGGVIDRLVENLSKAGVAAITRRQRGEPTVEDVDAAAQEARRGGCDCAIGLGGGSAIDAAKACAGLISNPGGATDYMEVVGKGQKIIHPAAPWMAIPATAGTGAEATRNAVVGLPAKKFKASIRSELLLPRIALIDPELGMTVPPGITASCGMDALCQLIESYTSTGASPMTDLLALRDSPGGKMPAAGVQERKRYRCPRGDGAGGALERYHADQRRAGAVHGFAAPLGANFPVPHGTVCRRCCCRMSSRPMYWRCACRENQWCAGCLVMPRSAGNCRDWNLLPMPRRLMDVFDSPAAC